ncbi:uncharacterized protein LOC111830675 [Capsella rubella]|uniref:uncharacterized protein LOC111830675 n=1 Tax=Capsella rubella TaxID=81985 RepID=UPI000CD4D699|nr:uncharacterized protein LOC111830675 [Capsella rubella]
MVLVCLKGDDWVLPPVWIVSVLKGVEGSGERWDYQICKCIWICFGFRRRVFSRSIHYFFWVEVWRYGVWSRWARCFLWHLSLCFFSHFGVWKEVMIGRFGCKAREGDLEGVISAIGLSRILIGCFLSFFLGGSVDWRRFLFFESLGFNTLIMFRDHIEQILQYKDSWKRPVFHLYFFRQFKHCVLSTRVSLCSGFLWFSFWSGCGAMSQSGLLGKSLVGMQEGGQRPMRRIKIARFDNSALIAGYSKTVIGRCLNPQMQDMKSLLIMLPRIWQMEGKVAGADLGSGKFQFDFDEEADIVAVLKMEPFHFDSWMVSMVRWKPVVDPLYPSALTFWIRVIDVPLQFWADPTFNDIGSDLGHVEEVDINRGRVKVTVDGYKPLCFATEIEFYDGEVTIVKLFYERLYGWCRNCFSLCHDKAVCPLLIGSTKEDSMDLANAEQREDHHMSYRGAVLADRRRGVGTDGLYKSNNKGKGIGESSSSVQQRSNGGSQYGGYKAKAEHSSGVKARSTGSFRARQHKESHGKVQGGSQGQSSLPAAPVSGSVLDPIPEESREQESAIKKQKKVRKALFTESEENGEAMANLVTGTNQLEEGQLEESDHEMEKIVGLSLGSSEVEAICGGSKAVLAEELSVQHTEEQGLVVDSAVVVDNEDLMGQDGATEFGFGSHISVSRDEFSLMVGIEEVSDHPIIDEKEVNAAAMDVADSTLVQNFGDDVLTVGNEGRIHGSVDTGDVMAEKEGVGRDAAGDKGKRIPGPLILKGVSARKRNAQLLLSPRKRQVPHGLELVGGGHVSKLQEKAKGGVGGAKPPKPTVDK